MAKRVTETLPVPVPNVGRDNIRSVLNVDVSCFANFYTPDNPRTVNLLKWLTSAKYRNEIDKIRATIDKQERDKVKAQLPCITPSGLFTKREESGLVQHSGLLQFDIDGKDNPHLTDFRQVVQQIGNICHVAYCGLSASGKGCWGLVLLAYPEKHKEQFEALRCDFMRYGIVLDEKPKNVASLRGYSSDTEAYFNHQPVPYEKWVGINERTNLKTQGSDVEPSVAKALVEQAVMQVSTCQLDLTPDYATWFEIGCSIANTFGEDGRWFFHQISQYHPTYSVRDTDRQYTYCLRQNYSFTLGTLIYHCRQAGLEFDFSGTRCSPALDAEPVLSVILTPAERKLQNVVRQYRTAASLQIALALEPTIPTVAVVQQEESVKCDDRQGIRELVAFFEKTTLPDGPVQLDEATTIRCPQQFVLRHIAYLQGNYKWCFIEPYYTRLLKLGASLSQNEAFFT